MKKFLALLCAALLAVSFASADSADIVEFRDRLTLNGALPDGYRFFLKAQTDLSLEGEIASENGAAPVMEVYIAFNESVAQTESLKDLDETSLELIKQGFSTENNVAFELFDTASGDSILMIRETGGQFLDFYTVCLGHEIELTLFPADGQTLTDAQVSLFRDFIRSLDIQPNVG